MLYTAYVFMHLFFITSSIYQCQRGCCSGACEHCFFFSIHLCLTHSSFQCILHSNTLYQCDAAYFCLCRSFVRLSSIAHVLIRISLAAETIDFAFWIEYYSLIANFPNPTQCVAFGAFEQVSSSYCWYCYCCCCCASSTRPAWYGMHIKNTMHTTSTSHTAHLFIHVSHGI